MCEIDGVHLTAAAIITHDGSIWARSATFPQFKHEEIAKIMKDFDEPGFLAPAGLYLGGTKKGFGGVTIKKTDQALEAISSLAARQH